MRRTYSPLLLVALVVGCQEPELPSQADLDLDTAQREFPTLGTLQTELLTNTCSPNPGVCHNSREYPELHTLTDLFTNIHAPCNVVPPAPELGWDACERAPDWLELGEFVAPIAWTRSNSPTEWTLGVPEPIPTEFVPSGPLEDEAAEILRIVDGDDALTFTPAGAWITTLSLSEDRLELTFEVEAKDGSDIGALIETVMSGVVGGDPNGNGVWGGSGRETDQARMLVPGSLRRSYLWRRMIGDVPGSRMPIANGPVTNAQMLAFGCWIEGLPEDPSTVDPADPIDYSSCSFADDPPLLVDLPDDMEEADAEEG